MKSGVITPNDREFNPETLAPDALARAAVEARTVLEAAATAAAEAAEQALAVAVALDEALANLDDYDVAAAAGNNRATPPARFGALSPREQEVLALVARGYTNKSIADTLYVSPNTVKTHVASLLHKLDAETRAQLAAIATRKEHPRGPM